MNKLNDNNFKKEKEGADNKSKKKNGVIKNRSDDSVNRNGTNDNNNNSNNTRVLHIHAPLLLVAMHPKVQKLHWREDIQPQKQDRQHLLFWDCLRQLLKQKSKRHIATVL